MSNSIPENNESRGEKAKRLMRVQPAEIDPQHIAIRNGDSSCHVMVDGDLGVNVRAGKDKDGRPVRYDAQGGMVLIALDVDGCEYDEVHVGLGERGLNQLDTLREAAFVIEQSIQALEHVMGEVPEPTRRSA